MSITLELSPETEARLIAQAAARGISVEELLNQPFCKTGTTPKAYRQR